jgi:hypothetical protein
MSVVVQSKSDEDWHAGKLLSEFLQRKEGRATAQRRLRNRVESPEQREANPDRRSGLEQDSLHRDHVPGMWVKSLIWLSS